jgi:hypothetical protein
MNEIVSRSQRAAPFYFQYWDLVKTESSDDSTVGQRNAVVEAIVDLLCFAANNNVDGDVVIETAKRKFLDIKMSGTYASEDDAAG